MPGGEGRRARRLVSQRYAAVARRAAARRQHSSAHVGHALMKLDLRDRVHAAVYAYESGLVRPGDAA